MGYLARRIEQARQEKVNLVFFQIDSPGGLDSAADSIADLIAGIKDMKTVAYIDDRAARRRRAACPWPAATSSSRSPPGWATSARSSPGATASSRT